MRASVLRRGQMVYRDDVPEPVPGPGQVLVSVRACGICGSDLHFIKHGAQVNALSEQLFGVESGAGDNLDLEADVFMGHELSAEVLEAGPGTDAPVPGTLVTSMPVLIGAGGIPRLIVYNNDVVGGYAEQMLLSAPLLLTVPNGLSAQHAALTEPMAVGHGAVNESDIVPGETALVLGCGPVGIGVIASLKARGVDSIVAADFSATRRQLATQMGAHRTVDPAQASPFDVATPEVVFEAVGMPGVIDEILRRANPGARVVVVGVCMEPDTIHPFFASMKAIALQFVFGYSADEFAHTLRLISEGVIDVAPLITAEVGLEDVDAAFHALADPDRHCKILVTPSGGIR
jgi:threonine dehydrogenase-like Zn-dependent dehydrogenase